MREFLPVAQSFPRCGTITFSTRRSTAISHTKIAVFPRRAGMVLLSKTERTPPAQLVAGLYFGFILTGIGTNLLGCILPALSVIWNLSDSHSGFLFAVQFVGSSM